MVDLIPIGTVNRAPNENNPSKVPDQVQETSRTKELASDGQPARIERRRYGDRRRGNNDRRLLDKAFVGPNTDRRRSLDRRLRRSAKPQPREERKPISRKGRIIDERA